MADVIIPLDRPTRADAMALVDRLGDAADFYKVGLELFGRTGPDVVRELRDRGKRVFLDLKFHDIPNTVRGAVAAAAALDVDLLTVHAAGGAAMIAAAREAAGEAAHATPSTRRTRILAVTVLTSLGADDVTTLWGRDVSDVAGEVVRLAEAATGAGADGVVSSPREAARLREVLGPGALIVTPGIRPAGSELGDQRRVATPADAVSAGATHLVIGRPVTEAPDPARALDDILAEIAGAEAPS